jgi:UDP-glucuronate 4-epimerase
MAPILFADKIQKGEAMDVYNNGEMWRDFTYVGDICESIYQLLNKQPQPNPDYKLTNPLPSGSTAPYKIYNIGNNNPIKLVDFIEEMEHAFGKQTPKNYLPMQPGDVEKTFADSSSLYNAINFKPATTLRDGIKAFADWYKEYYKH